MTGHRAACWAAVAALAAAAGFLALLAADVLRWRSEIERADLRVAVAPGAPAEWAPSTRLPAGWSRGLLGLSDDVAFGQALQRFRQGRPGQPARDQHDVALRAEADFELARVTGEPARRARAEVLRGVLALEDARSSGPRAGASLRRSLEQFRDAIRTDPANEDAKYDLELVLRLVETTGAGQGQQQGRRPRRGSGGGSGAGSSTAGGGF